MGKLLNFNTDFEKYPQGYGFDGRSCVRGGGSPEAAEQRGDEEGGAHYSEPTRPLRPGNA